MNLFFITTALVYLSGILFFLIGLFRFSKGNSKAQPAVSVLIPARNEAQNIVKCVESILTQNYPVEMVEIIVLDDDSGDDTAELVRALSKANSQVRLISVKNHNAAISPKKNAIIQGISTSENEIIFTIDADCEAPLNWLAAMMSFFDEKTGMVAGPVIYHRERNLFERLQSLEFLGIVTAGAGSLGMNRPLIANGANLAYRKSVFLEVGGFSGFEHVASGDDDLLMQKIAKETGWKIRFAADEQALIKTRPNENVKQFLNQRTRWASKGTIYPNSLITIFLVMIYTFYMMLFLSPLLVYFWGLSLPVASIIFLTKLLVDFAVVGRGCWLFRRVDLLKYFLIAEVLQIPYILYVGARGTFGNYKWKDRI